MVESLESADRALCIEYERAKNLGIKKIELSRDPSGLKQLMLIFTTHNSEIVVVYLPQ